MKKLIVLCFLVAACGDDAQNTDPKTIIPAENSEDGEGLVQCVNDTQCDVGEKCSVTTSPPSCIPALECLIDIDCAATEVCENGKCYQGCGDSDCNEGTCWERTVGTNGFCFEGVPSSAFLPHENNDSENNSSNMGHTNSGTDTSYPLFMISDTTLGIGCDTDDPGSDLQYVRISDGTRTVGYGRLDNAMFGGGYNEFQRVSVLDGTNRLGGNCVDDFSDDSVVSMGCEGEFFFQSLDLSGNRFDLVPGTHRIEVGEYGVECDGSSDDSYQVWVCEDEAVAGTGNSVGCGVFIGRGSGINTFAVLEP